MPNRRHCDLIALTQFHHHRHHLQIRARALVQQWRAARAQAETRALAMVAEAQRIREEGRATDAARQAFEQLKRRHRAHHEQARREHEERRAREEEERTREREREQQRMERAALLEEKRRGKAREALVQRRSQMILQQRAQQELHEARERKRASEKARQGRENAQRVAFRQERLKETRARAAVEEAERTAAKREREERLQALRDTVTVSIESDPTRVFAPTAASRARTTTTEPEALSLSEPFQDPQRLLTSHALHSYTSDQVLRDPRVRLEMLLRRANVQDTPYARSVLASVKGCQQPRRDMYSQIFKQ